MPEKLSPVPLPSLSNVVTKIEIEESLFIQPVSQMTDPLKDIYPTNSVKRLSQIPRIIYSDFLITELKHF